MSTTNIQVNFEKIPVSDLTEANLDGKGVYDILMRANKAYLQQEYDKDRIKGVEYSTVYLGLQEPTMRVALEFLLQQQKAALEAALLEKQILLAGAELEKAKAAIDLSRAQIEIAHIEADIARENLKKLPEEIEQIKAQTALIKQQKVNLSDELLSAELQRVRITKENEHLDLQKLQTAAQTDVTKQQKLNLADELLTSQTQRERIVQDIEQAKAQIDLTKQQVINAKDDLLTASLQRNRLTQEVEQVKTQVELNKQQVINAKDDLLTSGVQRTKLTQEVEQTKAQTANIQQQTQNAITQNTQTIAQTDLIKQNTKNALTQNTTMLKEQCKLDAEFDLLKGQVIKTTTETGLLNQKVATERAQTTASGVDSDSVIGKQKALYSAQTEGFKRDAELNVAKLMVDTWTVRRTSDEGTQANTTNQLDDVTIGRAVKKLFQGVGI